MMTNASIRCYLLIGATIAIACALLSLLVGPSSGMFLSLFAALGLSAHARCLFFAAAARRTGQVTDMGEKRC